MVSLCYWNIYYGCMQAGLVNVKDASNLLCSWWVCFSPCSNSVVCLTAPHATPIFPPITHFLQEPNLFLSSPDILKASPAGPAQVSRLQRSPGWSQDWICANFFSTLVSHEQRQAGHIWQQRQQEKDGGITAARDWIKEVGTGRLLRAVI